MSDISGADAERTAREAKARRQVAAIKGFYVHLAIFIAVIAGLFLIDWLAGGAWWAYWVMLGWGVGVAAHAFAVFSGVSRRVASWEERKVQDLAREEQR